MIAKPIFIVRFPNVENVTHEEKKDTHEKLKSQLEGYYVLCVWDDKIESVTFECFNHNLSEIELEELKLKLNL